MNNLKIGDKVRIKKLSNTEFKEIYYIKYHNYLTYKDYLDGYKAWFNQIFKICDINGNKIYCKCGINYDWFYKEEVEKISYIKTKFKIVRELLKNE